MTEPVTTPLLELKDITKSFPGCLANDSIDLTIAPGEIHALVGENGAGKSTLVKIIYGVLQANRGEMRWRGEPVWPRNPAAARQLGICMVFQHFSLFDSMTVAENIALGLSEHEPAEALRSRIVEVSRHFGLPLDPDRYVHTLSVGERQRVEIVRALLQQPQLLIMDEPTSVLTPQEVERLFATLHQLSEEGVAILYISHKLEEIRRLCHRATILRQGRKVAEVDPTVETTAGLARLMIGEELATAEYAVPDAGSRVRLVVEGLSDAARSDLGVSLVNIGFTVREGEILGIAGVAGNGQTELFQAISGEIITRPEVVRIDGRACGHLAPGSRRLLGLNCVPEKRLGYAAVPDLDLAENSLLTSYHRERFTNLGLVSRRACDLYADDIIDRYRVKTTGGAAPAESLSGGNLQKFIVGRELLQNPGVLVVAQPTWGVDAGAEAVIHQALRDLAAGGAAIVVISQDLDELMSVSHRVAVISEGRLSPPRPVNEVSVEALGLLMGGVYGDQQAVVTG
ncbi:MAG: ABC transporter ATP-binding protein [Pseudomonadota bacterium]|nr:ABC transporter ATP-binding protein [Pseudomonadota bacterium]